MGLSIGGFREEPKGNLGEGGTTRGRGEEEQGGREAKLSSLEKEMRPQTEAFEAAEIRKLQQILDELGYRAKDVIQYEKMKNEVIKKLPPQFRYGKLDEHLAALAKQYEAKRIKFNK